MQNDEHSIGIDELFQRLGTDSKGLSSQEARERQKQYGLNVLEKKQKTPFVIKFGKHLLNFFAILLWFGALLAFVSEYLSPGEGSIYIGIALSVVVILNASFTFVQEHQSEKIIESFRKMMPLYIEVLRDSRRVEIPSSEVVPGDIVYLDEGNKIPVDGRLLELNNLKVDHSSLTGESEPQLRKLACTHHNILESRNMVFSGTLVQSGNGVAIAYGTGMNTQIGLIADLTKQTTEVKSPLKKELDHFIRIISAIAIILGITFLLISIAKGDRIMASLIFAIGIIVANVPEGLLPTVTLCLSMASRKMAKKMALIKHLDSVETLGSTTVICTDKTGTITENRLSLNSIYINLYERHVDEKGLESLPGMEEMNRIMVLCNNARLDESGTYHGDPTDRALLAFAGNFAEIDQVRQHNERIYESPFDSKSKRMITTNISREETVTYMKGAPETVLDKCSRILINDIVFQFHDLHRQEIMKHYERLASRGERVLGLAYKTGESGNAEDFTFVALAGMLDPPRKEIPAAIVKCRRAGIKVIMITGDYGVTAEAVARKARMLSGGEAAIMTGQELDSTDDEQLREFLKGTNLIFARSSPLNKLRIVKTLQAMGEVVTVTGDGVNDAPALKNADIGVAMGIAGTEVAKEAAKMVLLDDNFASIVNAVEEGRTVFDNIQKFIAYILTSNVPQILPFIAFVLLDIPLPLTVILILSIDLGTDLLPALGLGVETPETDVMKRPPRSRSTRLLTPNMLFMSYGIYGMIQAAGGFFSYFVVLFSGGWTWGQHLDISDPLYLRAVTAYFTSIIICQIANVLACRTRRGSVFKKGLFSNRLVMLGIASELIFLSMIVYYPPTHRLFNTHSLTLFEVFLSLPFALLILLGDESRKSLLRKGNTFIQKYLNW